MIVLGDISGIQSFLFDVAESGGGQARRLRARSFLIQLLAEAGALRILRALNWPPDDSHLLLSVAGKFILRGVSREEDADILSAEQDAISEWMLRETNGALRLTLAWADHSGSEVDAYRLAQRRLYRSKARAWPPSPVRGWVPQRLVLAPLDSPCALCGHARGAEDEEDPDTGDSRLVCRWCAATRRLGQRLPRARWLVVRDAPAAGDLNLLGLGVGLSDSAPLAVVADIVAVANLVQPETCPPWCPPKQFLVRRLMAHVPVEGGTPVTFVDLARRSAGDHLLGVLKADADSLGLAVEAALSRGPNLRPLAEFSRALDGFFAARLKSEIESGRHPRWQSIYTIFGGGDDLAMVGPWDVMIAFAGRLDELFRAEFAGRGLTLSAGLALTKPKRPIKAAIAEADRLLEIAKTSTSANESGPKDQLAVLGQVWKWRHHHAIVAAARRLVGWCDDGQIERGWLHTLLALAEARHGRHPEPRATARLAHHVSRNYRPRTLARDWADDLVQTFDDATRPEVRYLPATLRYALVATRKPGEEE